MRKISNKNAQLNISFGWIFAILVGGFILFLTIFGVTKLVKTEQTSSDAKMGKDLGVLLNPLETSFETGKTSSIILPVETRIYNRCELEGVFGKQKLKVSQLEFKKWTETDIESSFYNKYIFSKSPYVQGKKFYVFSKPFEFPFKVSDLIYVTSADDKYCFINAEEEIKEELKDLNQSNIFVEDNSEDCPEKSINVCFKNPNCEIYVDYEGGYVKKRGNKMYFSNDALMYAGIFSDKNIYECQLKRLMNRTAELADIYKNKAGFVSSQGCGYLSSDLSGLSSFARNLKNSQGLLGRDSYINKIENKNKMAGDCRLW